MAQSALGQLGMVAMSLIGLVGMVRAAAARRAARRSKVTPQPKASTDSAAQVERRMAAYLASRDRGGS
jgi:hypothetical protein